MKNKKLLGGLIALGGSFLAIGSAFALYQANKIPTDKTIIIGTKVTGDVVLHADVENADTAHAMLVPNPDEHTETRTRSIELSAGFTTAEDSVYVQDAYLARLDFSVVASKAEFITAVQTNSAVQLGIQSTNAYGEYWANKWLNGGNKVISNEGKTITWSAYYPLLKGEDISRFRLDLRLNDDLTAEQYLAAAESTYTVYFNVSEAPELADDTIAPEIGEFKYAYVIGDATGGWEDKEEFRMVPNPMASGFEWMFKAGTAEGKQKLADGKDFKLHVNGTYCCSGANHVWSASNNGQVITWNGSENGGYIGVNPIHS